MIRNGIVSIARMGVCKNPLNSIRDFRALLAEWDSIGVTLAFWQCEYNDYTQRWHRRPPLGEIARLNLFLRRYFQIAVSLSWDVIFSHYEKAKQNACSLSYRFYDYLSSELSENLLAITIFQPRAL